MDKNKYNCFQATSQKLWTNYKKAQSWLKSCLVLMFLLGMLWILNIVAAFTTLDETTYDIIQLLAIVINCSCGFFIFLYSVVCNKNVRSASKKFIRTSTLATKSTSKSSKRNNNAYMRNLTARKKAPSDQGSAGSEVAIIGKSDDGTQSSTSTRMKRIRIVD